MSPIPLKEEEKIAEQILYLFWELKTLKKLCFLCLFFAYNKTGKCLIMNGISSANAF